MHFTFRCSHNGFLFSVCVIIDKMLFPFHAVCAFIFPDALSILSFPNGFQNDFEMTLQFDQLLAGIHAHRQTCMWRAQRTSFI